MGDKWLVLPTNRPERLPDFFEAWEGKGGWDRVCVVEDAPQRSEAVVRPGRHRPDVHVSWYEMEEQIGSKAWDIFSRCDSAIRCYGFWKAWQAGAEYVLTLDDDVLPVERARPIFDQHIEAMTDRAKWIPSVPGTRTRGLPYRNLGTLKTAKASMGWWSGVPDYDAVQSLSCCIWEKETPYSPPLVGGIMPNGVYFPMCGMNLCIHRDAIPCFYFPLMGSGRTRPFARFDDIFAGIIAKKVFDFLGWQFVVGGCVVRHERASDPFVNLVKEAPGIVYNETFWEIVDAESFFVGAAGKPLEAMLRIAARIADYGGPYSDYQIALAQGILGWVGLFR